MDTRTLIVGLLVVISGIISIELGISTAILLIIAGTFSANFLGFQSNYWIDFLANLGMLGILFLAGLEVDFDVLQRNWRKNLALGIMGYVTPFLFLLLFSFYIFAYNLQTSIIIAIALSTTSLSLVYCILRTMLDKKELFYQMMLGSAVVIDVLTMITFSVLMRKIDLYDLRYFLAMLIFLFLTPIISKYFIKRYEKNPAEIEIRLVLLLLLILSFISSKITILESVFVFVLGVLFSKFLTDPEVVEDKLRGLIFGFLAPIFFFKAGLLMVFPFGDYSLLLIILGVIVIAYLSKLLGIYLIGRVFLGHSTALTMGFYFNFRLSFALVISVYGITHGLITNNEYFIIVSSVLLTSLISSLILRVIPQENYVMLSESGIAKKKPCNTILKGKLLQE